MEWTYIERRLRKMITNFFFFLINLFIYLWLRWVYVAACGLSPVAVSRGHSSRCTGFSLHGPSRCGTQALGARASVVVARGLQRTGSAVVVHGPSRSTAMWDPPGPGLEPVSPALAGGFLTDRKSTRLNSSH